MDIVLVDLVCVCVQLMLSGQIEEKILREMNICVNNANEVQVVFAYSLSKIF